MVTLTGTFTRLDGTPATGTVRVTPSRSPIMDPQGRVVISGPQTFPLDKDGKLTFQIPPSNDPDLGPAFTYTVEALLSHNPWKISKVWIPHGPSTIDISTIADYTPLPGEPTRTLTVPADGADGQVLVWDGTGFSWDYNPGGRPGPIGPQGPAIDINTGLPIQVNTTVGTRVFIGGHMVHGDTGWRDIRGLLENGWTAQFLRVRRVGNTVNILGRLNGSAKTGDKIMQSPPGFAFYAGSHELTGRLGGDRLTLMSGGAIASISTSISAGLFETWVTNDPWPTTLPGLPV